MGPFSFLGMGEDGGNVGRGKEMNEMGKNGIETGIGISVGGERV